MSLYFRVCISIALGLLFSALTACSEAGLPTDPYSHLRDTNTLADTPSARTDTPSAVADTEDSKTIEPIDESPPSWPADATIKALVVTDMNVILQWSAATDPSGIQSYQLYIDDAEHQSYDSDTRLAAIESLEPNTTYTVRVEATDMLSNQSSSGPTIEITTTKAPSEALPESITLVPVSVTSTSVDLAWDTEDLATPILQWTLWQDTKAILNVPDGAEKTATIGSLTPGATYLFQLSATTLDMDYFPGADLVVSLPSASLIFPENAEIQAATVGETVLQLDWPDCLLGDVTYTVAWSHLDEPVGAATSDMSEYTIDGLTPWTDYDIAVTAETADGVQSLPLVATLKTADTTPPTWEAEAALELTMNGTGTAELNWTAASDNAAVTSYVVFRNGAELSSLPADETTYNAIGLTEGAGYLFTVQAVDGAGNTTTDGPSSFIELSDGTGPAWAEDATLVVDGVTQTTATLSWSLPTDVSPIQSLNLSIDGVTTLTLASDTVSVELDSLQPETTYTCLLTATDVFGNVSDSLTATVTTLGANIPSWPTDATVSVSDIDTTSAKLIWSLPNSDVATTSYTVLLNDIVVAEESLGTETTTLEGLLPETSYTVRVEAKSATGTLSSNGPTTTFMTLPDGPPEWSPTAALVAVPSGETALALSWFGTPDNIASLKIMLNGDLQATIDASQTTHIIDSLVPGTTYTLSIEAIGSTGLVSTNGPSVTATTGDETAPIFAPAATCTVGAVTASEAELQWSAATDTVGVTDYRIERQSGEILLSTTSGAQTATLQNLESETAYDILVRARDAAGNWSSSGPTASFTTEPLQSIVSTGGVYNALEPHCGGCHFNEFVTKEAFVATFVSDPTVISPGNASGSKLIQYLEGTYEDPAGGYSQMPPFDQSYAQLVASGTATLPISIIKAWVEAL
jgi:chitodextrinase